jgi:uncharacterized delta-60 repeat protein
MVRLNTDGTLDTSFDPGAGGKFFSVTASLRADFQPDGKILVSGQFSFYNGVGISNLARLNADGTLDTGFDFGPGTGARGPVVTSAVSPGGKIMIGGSFGFYNNISRGRVARLNADGTLDTTFDPGTGANDDLSQCVLQGDGKIIISGLFTSYNGTVRNYIARLNTDGSLDAGFDPAAGPDNMVRAVAIQADGKIIIGGAFTSFNGTSRKGIARLNADGSLDTGFNPALNGNGDVFTISIQPDGKIIAAGTFSYNSTRFRIARLNTDGTLDTGFTPGTGVEDNFVFTSCLQSDGKIIIGGNFTLYNGSPVNRIARLNTDGTLDQSFDPGTGPNSSVLALTLQGDGKIIIGGEFTSFNGDTQKKYIARLNADGSLDPLFDPGTGPSHRVNTISFQPDHKIIIGGSFVSYNGIGRNRIARIKTLCDLTPLPVITENFSDPEQPVLTSSYTSGNQWFLNDEAISGATSQSLSIDEAGIYTVQVLKDWCFGTSDPTAIIITGTEPEAINRSSIFPNPATEKITLSLSGFEEGKPVNVLISDLYGRTIEKTAGPGQQQLTFNVGSYTSGMYMVLMQQNKTRATTRFIKK